jgi:hypothetical protein
MASVGGNNDEQVWIAYLCFSGRNVLQRPTVPFTSAREVFTEGGEKNGTFQSCERLLMESEEQEVLRGKNQHSPIVTY